MSNPKEIDYVKLEAFVAKRQSGGMTPAKFIEEYDTVLIAIAINKLATAESAVLKEVLESDQSYTDELSRKQIQMFADDGEMEVQKGRD